MRTHPRHLIGPAALVSVALVAVNGLAYGVTVLAARSLGPAAYGEFAALLVVLLVGAVAGTGVQAVTALVLGRAVVDGGPGPRDAVRGAHAVALAAAVVCSLLALLAVPLVVAVLHLSAATSAVLLVAALGPHVLLGGYEGISTGTGRFRAAATATVAFGSAKSAGTVAGLVLVGTVPGALAGLAVGCGVGLVGAWCAAGRPGVAAADLRSVVAPLGAVGRAAGAMTGFTLLLGLDLLLARHHLSPAAAGEYAVGAVLTKVAFWLPQGVGFVLLPRLAGHRPRDLLLAAVGVVGAVGAVGTLVLAAVGPWVLALVGGAGPGRVGGLAWLFWATGTVLAVAQLTVFSALARRDTWVTVLVWAAGVVEVAVVAALAALGRLGPTSLLVVAAGVASVVCLVAGRRALHGTHTA